MATPAKKLYLVSYVYAPVGRASGINRAYLTRYLSQLGWDIDVFCCSNPHAFLRSWQRDPSLLQVIPDAVRRHAIPSWWWGPTGGLLQLARVIRDPFLNWYRPAVKAALPQIREPGIIYAVIPPIINARVAFRLAQATGMPLVLDFRNNVFGLPPEWVRSCAGLLAASDRSVADMRAAYGLTSMPALCMYGGAVVDDPPQPEKTYGKQLRIVYAGLLNLNQEPAQLARARRLVEQRYPGMADDIRIDYYGPRNFYTALFLRRFLSTHVQFHGYLPLDQTLQAIAAADLGYLSLRPRGNAYCIPSKLYQYMAVGTPILAAGPPEGAVRDLVEPHGIGRYSAFDDLDAQVEDLKWLFEHPEERRRMSTNLAGMRAQFSMQAQTQCLAAFLESL